MTVLCNGNPKAGVHALTKAVELLGFPSVGEARDGCCWMGHWPYGQAPDAGKHVHIIRDPKAMLISWVRFQREDFAPGWLIAAFKSYYEDGPIYEEFSRYEPWLHDDRVLTVRFEDLVGDTEATAATIARYLDTPVLPGIPERLLGGTLTWSGKLTVVADYWSDQIQEAWEAARGPEIEAMFGYG